MPRDGRFVGAWALNPMLPRDHDDRLVLKSERINYCRQGARPTDRVHKMPAGAG